MTDTIDTCQSKNGEKTCIYCGSAGPFTDEHIFCAGLGGDDAQFILRDIVCGECNTNRFSPIEAEFMRNSAESFTRILVQPTGRKRKKGNNAPKFRPSFIRVFLPDGAVAEAAMKARGEIVLLPQYSLAGKELQGQCSNKADMARFIEELSLLLTADSVPVVTKSGTKGRPLYAAISYSWSGTQYVASSREFKLVAPKPRIWRDKESNIEPADQRSRIFRRPDGEIVIRLGGTMGDAELLTVLRTHLAEMHAEVNQAVPAAPIIGAAVSVLTLTEN